MYEYSGDSVQKYAQPTDKYFTLFPALSRLIPQASSDETCLDFGCGTADLYPFIIDNGYQYTGLDISPDMLSKAKSNYPNANLIQSSVTQDLSDLHAQFDVILCNMLFPSISSHSDFRAVFKNINQLLKAKGIAIITIAHPCFDGYMTKHFFNRKDIIANFDGYFSHGSNYEVHRKIGDNDFVFSDHHWTLSDYINTGIESELSLLGVDECDLIGNPPENIAQKIKSRGIPSYLAIKFQK